METDYLVLRGNITDYIFPYLSGRYNIQPVFSSVKERKLIHLMSLFGIYNYSVFGKWKKDLKKYKKIIMYDHGWDERITRFIKREHPECELHLFFFNKISVKVHQMILKDKNIDKIWSFDKGDVRKYRLNFKTPYYETDVPASYDNNACNDVVFVGAVKNRRAEIERAETLCRRYNISTDFYIVTSSENRVSYNDYIKAVLDSKCILDITASGQMGLTLRFMEAMFLSRKIITNNLDVRDYDFYCSDNVFILDYDRDDCLCNFIHTPYKEIPEEIVKKYRFQSWIQGFS